MRITAPSVISLKKKVRAPCAAPTHSCHALEPAASAALL
jgi:hypothetical protein